MDLHMGAMKVGYLGTLTPYLHANVRLYFKPLSVSFLLNKHSFTPFSFPITHRGKRPQAYSSPGQAG